MKKLLLLMFMAFTFIKASAQIDSPYTYIGPDSISATVHDTIYSNTINQRFGHIFENLDTE